MSLEITPFVGGDLETNTFLVADPDSKTALIIDAAQDTAELVQQALRNDGLTPQAIVITHTHWDHIADATKMRRLLGVPLLGNAFATTLFGDGRIAAPGMPEIEPFVPDRNLDEGDEVTLGEHTFTVLFVPGHERAHIALWSEADNVLLSGDVLFPGGHGTTEIPGSDQRVITQTVRRLARLPEATVVYPGHGATTTIGAERHWIAKLSSNSTD
jgi:glyoxylase-like metal-dependent hydrolase (beta-lactamase superfamily II)